MESGPRPFFNDIQVVDKGKVVDNADASLAVTEQHVTVKSDTAAVTLTLPDVSEAKGKMFSIVALDGLANNVTVQDNNESLEWTDVVMAGTLACLLLFSDGRTWYTIASKDGTTA